MILLTSYYHDKERQGEIDFCLLKNIENEYIKTIILFCEVPFDSVPFEDSKLILVDIGRPTFKDYFDYMVDGEVNIIANSDIYLNETCQYFNRIKLEECFAITRHELVNSEVKPFSGTKPEWSQDVWVFRRKPRLLERFKKVKALNLTTGYREFIDFYMGVPGCDNHFAFLLRNEFALFNPYPLVKVIHVHENEERNYKLNYRITGNTNSQWGQLTKVKPI